MFHKRLMQEFRDNMKYVAGMVATQWLMLIANVFFMYTLAGFISSAADGTAKTADLQKIFIVLACVIAVRAVSTYVNSRLSFAASCNVKSRIRKMVYEKLMRFSGSYREHLSSAEAVQISTEGVEQLEIYFGKYVPQFFYSMSPEELHQFEEALTTGKKPVFSPDTLSKWQERLNTRESEINAKFAEANKKSEELCRQRTAKK